MYLSGGLGYGSEDTFEIIMLETKTHIATVAAELLYKSHLILWHGLNIWIANGNVEKGQRIADYFMRNMIMLFLPRENHPISELHPRFIYKTEMDSCPFK